MLDKKKNAKIAILIVAVLFMVSFIASHAAKADNYEAVPGTGSVNVWDTTNGSLYSIGINGQPSATTIIPNQATNNTWTGSNTFNGTTVINNASGIGQSVLASSTTQTALASTTTLTAVTGLSVPVVAGGTYYCTTYLPITANASGGVQVAFAGANSMTATSANYQALTQTTTANDAFTNTTTFGSAVGGYTGAATNVALQGTVVVNAAGNLIVEGAQNASNGSATTFLANSTLSCVRTN